MSIPKFDVSSGLELTSILKALGVTDIFDPETADFSPMLPESELSELMPYLSDASSSLRVTVDEKGCEAAAYIKIMIGAMASEPSDETVDFVVDRPFIFALTGHDGLPLFIGIVNHP